MKTYLRFIVADDTCCHKSSLCSTQCFCVVDSDV